MTVYLPDHSFPLARYRDMKRKPDGSLLVFLDDPRDVIRVTDPDDVEAAIAAILFVLGEREREVMGGGWVTLIGEDD